MYLKILIMVCLTFTALNVKAAASGERSEGPEISAASKAVSGGGAATSTKETVKSPIGVGARATRVMANTGGGAKEVTEGGALARAGTTGTTDRLERVEDENG